MSDSYLHKNPEENVSDLHAIFSLYYNSIVGRWKQIAYVSIGCLALAAAYLVTATRTYSATAKVLILKDGRPLNMVASDPGEVEQGDDYITTNAHIINSQTVIKAAIQSLDIDKFPSLSQAKRKGLDLVQVVTDRLSVDRPDRLAKILRLRYQAPSRDEAMLTLEAVTQSYKKFLEGSFRQSNREDIALISGARDELSGELKSLEQKYREFRRQNKTMMADEKGRSFISTRLEHTYRAANEAKLKAVLLRSQIEAAQKLAKEGAGLWAIAHAVEQLGTSTDSSWIANASGTSKDSSQDYVRQLTQEQQKLVDRFGPQNAKVQDIKDQIDRVVEDSHNSRQRLERGQVRDLLASLEQGLKSIEGMREELNGEFARDLSEAKEIEEDLMIEANLRDELDRRRTLYNTVVEHLKQAQFAGDYSTLTCRVIDPPNSPQKPSSPRMSITLGLALGAGLLLGIVSAVLGDHMDQRLRSASEIRKAFGHSALGQIAKISGERASSICSAARIAHVLPGSGWAESYRVARTNIEMLCKDRKIQVLLVTSPLVGDGKSTTASNLATILALAGRKVLLIDADLRRPSLHNVHGIGRDRGLTHLLKNLLPLYQVVQRTAIEGLEVITAGPEVSNPSELLASSSMAAVLDSARQDFDFVIIDSPPALSVTDATIIGSAADGVLLVVKPSTVDRHQAQQTNELFQNLGTPILGLIINEADFGQGNYGNPYVDRNPTRFSSDGLMPSDRIHNSSDEPGRLHGMLDYHAGDHQSV